MARVFTVNNVKAGFYVALGFLAYRYVVKPFVDKIIP
tara:strand:+ start:385 stop:495 length:111 start_codon:yes stop_codon:yes gene_type:complete